MLNWLAILFFLAIGIVIGASVSWLVLNSLILESSAALSQIYIGAIAGFGATIAVLLALEIFRLVRDRSAAGSLFNGIANSSEGCQIYIIRMKDEQKSGKYITPIPDYSPSGDSTKYEGRQLTPWVTSTAEAEALKKTMPDADVKQNFHPTYEVFHSASIAREDARRQLNTEGNTVLFFGFVRPYKGMKYLIEAMPMIIKHIDISLLIVGKFWNEKEEYRKQIEDLGVNENIRMIDRYVPNEEVAIYFSAADVIVLPYTSGAGSGIVQIAFGFNKPVIATKIGCLPEVVDDGKPGYLVKPMDSQAIASAAVSFFKDGIEKAFARNIALEQQQFSWIRMIETIEAFSKQ